MSKLVKNLVIAVCFIFFLGMIMMNQKTISLTNLGLMIVGLCGLLALLYLYNRKYK